MVIVRRTIDGLLMIVSTLLLVSFLTVRCVGADEPSSIEQCLLADAADDSLDEFSLLEGSLIASGITSWQKVEHYCAEFDARIEPLALTDDDESTAISNPERIYRFLHGEFLVGRYYSTCTEVDRALDDGDYNCVTATILYHCVCKVHGLSPVAVATNTHVRSRFLGNLGVDVETTCRDWFDVARRDPQFHERRIQRQRTRPLSEVQLLAKIYYNRGVSLLEKEAYGNAIALLRVSRLLDQADEPTQDNLAAGLNNWALAECDAGNFERAIELVQQGWEQHPGFAPLLTNDVHIHQRWAVFLCAEGRFAEAMDVLHAAFLRRPDVPLFDRGRLVIYHQWAASLLERGDLDGAARLSELASHWFTPSDVLRSRSGMQTAGDPLLPGPEA